MLQLGVYRVEGAVMTFVIVRMDIISKRRLTYPNQSSGSETWLRHSPQSMGRAESAGVSID